MGKSKVKTPKYYNGLNDYTAKEVVDNFQLNYHLGTACTYILRAYKKHDTPNEDLQKAIDHLTFELERIEYIQQYNRNRDFKDHIVLNATKKRIEQLKNPASYIE